MDFDSVEHLFNSFLSFAMDYIGIPKCPDIHLMSDKANSKLPLGKTGSYDPMHKKIVIYTDNRHIKDILRSLSHELVHHKQNLQGMFDNSGYNGPGYAQKNQHLRNMEREAYEIGNLCLRDWEDKHKKQLQESIYTIKGDNSKMSYKKWRNGEINERLMGSWGYKAPKSEVINENKEISHLCAMLVTEKSSGKVGHPINHTLLEDGTVTHYDVEFDDVIVEGMPVDSLNVEVQQEHKHTGRRKDKDIRDEGKPREKYMEEEEVMEEGKMGDLVDKYGKTSIMALIAFLAANPDLVGDIFDVMKRNKSSLSEEELNEDVPEMSRAEAEKKFDKITDDGPGDMSIGHKGDETKMFKMTNEDLIRKTIREAITKALKERNEG